MAQRKTVLVVDDNDINLEVIQEILDGECNLLTASSGEEALRHMSRAIPDLVLLDIMMPGIDGYETCRRIRATPEFSQTMIILVSARAFTPERLEGYEAGANDYVTKPFNPDELLAKVRAFLRLKTIEEIDRIKSQLLTVLEHEIRTPLSGIIPAGELLADRQDLGTTDRRMLGETVLSRGQRLHRMTQRGMLLCRLREGNASIKPVPLEPVAAIRRAVAKFDPASQASIAVPELPVVEVQADPPLFNTMLECIFDGIQHLVERVEEIVVSMESDGGTVEISFHATDAMVSEHELEHAFEILGTRTIDGEVVGAHVALSLARAIAEVSHGSMDAARSGSGITLRTRFPVAVQHRVASP